MKLTPVTARPETSYPARAERRKGAGTWMRRALAAAAAASAIGLGGCYGATPFESGSGPGPTPEPTEPATISGTGARPGPFVPAEERMMGDMVPTFFVCGDVQPEEVYEHIWVPGYFEGSLCGEQTAWGAFDLESDGADVVLTLTFGAEVASVAVLAPDGSEAAVLDAGSPSAVVARHEGRYWLAATPTDPADHGYDWFSGNVELSGD